MSYPVRAGEAHHGAGEFSVPAVFIGEAGGVEFPSDPLPGLVVVAPGETGDPSVNFQPQVDRHVLHGNAGVQKFGLYAVFQMNDGKRASAEGFTVVFPEIDVVHIVVVEDQPRAVLVYLGKKFHFCNDPRVEAGEFSGQNADFI